MLEPFNIDDIDSDEYDTDAIQDDISSNNFSPDRLEEYRCENIVRESLINGQFTQAQRQCEEYGLDYDFERFKFDHDSEFSR